MNNQHLKKIACELVAPHKGILAADDGFNTIKKRFAKIKLPSSFKNRQMYRELLFSTPEIENYLSGIILFNETIKQSTHDGVPFIKLLLNKDIIPGIKVDQGTKPLPYSAKEKITNGLDGLKERLVEYQKLGARFTKWRAVITIKDDLPTDRAIQDNAQILTEFARISQELNLVPIIEPEVLADGDHDIYQCESATRRTLISVFDALKNGGVDLTGILLKPNMITSGLTAPTQASSQEVAERTVKLFKEVIPIDVPGIVFLSGGQASDRACENLNAINQLTPLPWKISFSFDRALTDEALLTWQGKQENVAAAQKVFLDRLKMTSSTRDKKY